MKLRDLHILMQVVHWGSMAKAAQYLGISSPVISKTIADLEHTLEVPLLDRTRRGIEPTLYGRALAKRGVAVFDELRESVKEMQTLADPSAGEVRIGCTEPLAGGIVPAIIERLNRQHPRILFQVVAEADFTTLLRDLRAREIDLMIGRTLQSNYEDDVESEILFNDRLVFVAGRENPWSRRRKIELAELVNEPWTLPPDGSVPRSLIVDAFQAAGVVAPRAIVTGFAIPLHTYLLASSRFLAVLPESTIHFSVKHLPIKVLPVDVQMQLSRVVVLALKNRTHSQLTQLFIACAREVAKPLSRRN